MTCVGILGGGQLGRMMILAGAPLGLKFRVFDPSRDASAGQVSEHVKAEFSDRSALERFAQGLDVATYEWENVPIEAARAVSEKVAFFAPGIKCLQSVQDRLVQKQFIDGLGIPVAPFESVLSLAELKSAVQKLGFPCVLKTRRFGYDGKGQFVIKSSSELETAWNELGRSPLILEKFVPFDREVSIVAVRSRSGETQSYCIAENRHRSGILRLTLAPAPGLGSELQALAEQYAKRILDAFDYVGVLTIEFFEYGGRLLINEIATRVHNSGHWTQDGAMTSQFENHLRAITGMPLGSTKLKEPFAMINLIGTLPDIKTVLAHSHAKIHLYGKEPKRDRKLGHINIPMSELQSIAPLFGKPDWL